MAGTQFARRVEGILSRAGQRFGEGELRGTLTRVTGRTGPSYAPTGETTQDYDFVGLWDAFTAEERAAGLIEDGDHKFLIGAATITTDPRAGDTMTVGGRTYQVKQVEIVRPGGVALLYTLKVRD